MSPSRISRRQFLNATGALARAELAGASLRLPCFGLGLPLGANFQPPEQAGAEYSLHIKTSPVEIAPKRIISALTYNGQFPGPLLRFKEGRPVTVDIHNDTDTPEQLHWHGQRVPVDVDGAAEEGTPFIPAHGKRHRVYTKSGWVPLLSHPQSSGRGPQVGSIRRRGRPRLYRIEAGAGKL